VDPSVDELVRRLNNESPMTEVVLASAVRPDTLTIETEPPEIETMPARRPAVPVDNSKSPELADDSPELIETVPDSPDRATPDETETCPLCEPDED
jgi:hypothetical protein